MLLFAGQYAALTYIAPFLGEVTGISGAFAGGRFADRSATGALVVANVVLILALGLLYLIGSAPVLVALTLVLWGLVGIGLVPSLQYRVIGLAGPGGNLAATLPASAINAGIAIGALVGGWAVAEYGPSAPVIAGVVVSVVALPATWATGRLRAPAVGERKAPDAPTEAPAGNR